MRFEGIINTAHALFYGRSLRFSPTERESVGHLWRSRDQTVLICASRERAQQWSSSF